MPSYQTIEDVIGQTPLVRLQRLPAAWGVAPGAVLLGKLEGNNPAGSVKDRPAMSMIRRAEERGDIRPGDTLIEATSGNTGIALAMAAAIRGYRMVLIMPEDLSVERAQTMKAFGAELILTPRSGGMEYARDLAEQMQKDGKGRVLDQFANADNPRVHFETTGPEIWQQTEGQITHFVSAMGTTGTITGVGRFLRQHNRSVRVIGAQPAEGSRIPGIRKWPEAYLPKIYDPAQVDELVLVSQADAEDMARRLAREEGLFAGISAAGAAWVALQLARQTPDATIVFIVCDRGERYLSTGVFPSLKRRKRNAMDAQLELDTRGLNCPLPILKAKKALTEIASGEVLKVVATDPGSVRDFQAFARQTGHELLEQSSVGDEFIHYLRRR